MNQIDGKDGRMTDDFTIFWRNDEHASALFYDLLDRSERGAYDDDFLVQLAAYREAAPESERADIFAAQYLLHHGDAQTATLCAERSYRVRPMSPAVWEILARSYKTLGRYTDALVMQGYLTGCGNPLALNLPRAALNAHALDRLSIAMSAPSYAPFATRMGYSPEEGLVERGALFLGETLPVSPHIEPPYYVGVYAEQGMQGDHVWQIDALRNAPGLSYFGGGDFTFDLIRAQQVPGRADLQLAPQEEVILPVLGTVLPLLDVQEAQQLRIQTDELDDTAWLNIGTPNFFRLDRSTTLSSAQDFVVGIPIRIGHSPTRRKFVLNLLIDALPWTVLRDSFAEKMPQTHHFFEKGTIFDQCFSTAEYTYPSIAAIETGMYPQHSGIFNDRFTIDLRPDDVTISERARTAGYATAQLMGFGGGVYNGIVRGYDRLIVSMYRAQTYEGVERVIRHLEAFPDIDHFLLLHASEVHPWPSPLYQLPSGVQAHLSLAERVTEAPSMPSPYMRPNTVSQCAFWQSIRDTDRALGTLFAYLEQHYAPEDYLVNLYSDHGVAIFSEPHDIVGTHLTGAAWMMRGAGVPAGVIADELTSTVDIYPALSHLLGFPVGGNVDGVLPKIFGGTGREVAFSNSLYPTKPYFLAARSLTHVLRLNTEEAVLTDGTVNLEGACVAIYPRTHEGELGYEMDTSELRAFFYPRVRKFLRRINNNGEVFPLSTAK